MKFTSQFINPSQVIKIITLFDGKKDLYIARLILAYYGKQQGSAYDSNCDSIYVDKTFSSEAERDGFVNQFNFIEIPL